MASSGTIQFCIAIIFVLQFNAHSATNWVSQKYSHRSRAISVEELKELTTPPQLRDGVTFESILDSILIPRVPGTPNHEKVKQFIIGEMKNLNWNVETDKFEDETPHGVKPFENIIATLNPETPRRLTLACHYDSKYTKDGKFVGATDSAVPCAMMIHLAYALQEPLELHKNNPMNNVTLQFIFFDGEEAFVQWTSRDSIYGSRHLAAKWEQTPYPPGQREFNELNRMDMLVLLDLLGTKNPTFLNFFQSTSHWHNYLVDIESTLRGNRLLTGRSNPYFQSRGTFGGVEDDHIPFLNRGVDILHVITTPFPSVWHKDGDDKSALDFPTIENLNRIFRVYVTSYLHLPVRSAGGS
jgi:glutaminyl-peptide cyclotransferase